MMFAARRAHIERNLPNSPPQFLRCYGQNCRAKLTEGQCPTDAFLQLHRAIGPHKTYKERWGGLHTEGTACTFMTLYHLWT